MCKAGVEIRDAVRVPPRWDAPTLLLAAVIAVGERQEDPCSLGRQIDLIGDKQPRLAKRSPKRIRIILGSVLPARILTGVVPPLPSPFEAVIRSLQKPSAAWWELQSNRSRAAIFIHPRHCQLPRRRQHLIHTAQRNPSSESASSVLPSLSR